MKKPIITQRVAYLLALGIGAKLLIDTSVQIFNPFLTMIASGAGISAVSLGGLLAFRGLTGLTAPFIGSVADRIGYRKIMQISLLLCGLGMIFAGISQNILLFSIAVIITGFGQAGFTPNLHAYLSSRLAYEKRARGIGIVEYSWALAGIIGLFAAGYLIDLFSWRAPFILFGVLLILWALFYFTIPEIITGGDTKHESKNVSIKARFLIFFDLGPNSRSAWGTIILQGLIMFAITNIMIIHGGLLEKEYGLGPSNLGKIAFVFGITDLTASVIVSLAVDRIGKKKSVVIGVVGMTLGYGLLPLLNIGLYPVIVALFIPRMFFEFAIVSNLALISEQVPEMRGKVLSLCTAIAHIGITFASPLGPLLYYNLGVRGLSAVSFIAGLAGLALLIFVIKEKSHHIIV